MLICLSAFLLEIFSTHDWMLVKVLQLTVIPCVNVFIHTHSCGSLFFDYRSGVTISALHTA